MTADEVSGLGNTPYQPHDVFRTGMAGLVEVWPVQAGAKKAELPMFDAPDLLVEEDSDTRHAREVVAHIKALRAVQKQICSAVPSGLRIF